MADDIELNSMSGGAFASADERTINSVVVKIQRMLKIGASSIATGQAAPNGTAGTLVSARETRERLVLINFGTVDVYVGPATVTTSNGVKIPPNTGLELHTTALVQGITASGTGAIHYLEEYS